jgi:acetyl esterase/lipase
MIRALWLEVPAIYFAWYEISDEQCENNIIDKQTKKGTVDAMKLHCTDFEKQVAEWDLEVFPGRMSVEDASNLPPTYVMTSEKDFMRRDAYAFAQTLEKAGKL